MEVGFREAFRLKLLPSVASPQDPSSVQLAHPSSACGEQQVLCWAHHMVLYSSLGKQNSPRLSSRVKPPATSMKRTHSQPHLLSSNVPPPPPPPPPPPSLRVVSWSLRMGS